MKQTTYNPDLVILCDGAFPEHHLPLTYLNEAKQIICCDGAADKLITFGMEPSYIVGDLDSVSELTKQQYADRLVKSDDQETNDQTKAVEFAKQLGAKNIVILGATGKREDHTMGNISLLLDYAQTVNVVSISNSGIFTPLLQSGSLPSFTGQQVSVFSIGTPCKVSSEHLKYPLKDTVLNSWWMGTLNEALTDTFSLNFSDGKLVVFQKFA